MLVSVSVPLPVLSIAVVADAHWAVEDVARVARFNEEVALAPEAKARMRASRAIVERLAEAHPVFVITSSRTATVERILSEHDVRGVVEVLGGDHEQSKTRKIRAVRRRIGESLPAWYVGDTIGDMVEARAAGAVTVGAAWGWHGAERLRRAAPDHLAHTPGDLLDLF